MQENIGLINATVNSLLPTYWIEIVYRRRFLFNYFNGFSISPASHINLRKREEFRKRFSSTGEVLVSLHIFMLS